MNTAVIASALREAISDSADTRLLRRKERSSQ